MMPLKGNRFAISLDFLKNPWVIILGMAAGIMTGMFNRNLALKLAPLGDAYLSFLSMCVIPIMATAVITSFGRLFRAREVSFFLRRIIAVFLLGLLITSFIGMFAAVTGKPGQLEHQSLDKLGKVLIQYERDNPGNDTGEKQSFGFYQFLKMIIPANIFNALYEGKNLQILFFSIVLGLSLGILPSEKADQLLDFTEVVFKAFEKAIVLAMYVLPLGLFCMLAGQIAQAGIDILKAMTKFVVIIHITGLVLVLLGSAVISAAAKKSFIQTFRDLREPLIIAFGTRNSYATMPSVFDTLRDNFNLNQNLINLVVPLSIVICRYSMVVVFTIGAVFMAQLYSMPLGIEQYMFIFLISVLAAVAGAGAPSVVALSMIAIVLTPLGLPSGAAIVLLLAVNAIIDPILTIINIHLTCAAAVLIAREGQGTRKTPVAGSV
ncbi:MAG: dicarboxylate/amino acid:cation symporter [Desulfocucumaceae bacterium]